VDDEKVERPDRLMKWFGRALMAADSDIRDKDERKGESWHEEKMSYLYGKMLEHVSKMRGQKSRHGAVNMGTGHIHAVKVVNYALMIATRITEDEKK